MNSSAIDVVVDADIVIKLSVLDLFSEALAAIGTSPSRCGMLRSMKFSAGVSRSSIRVRKAGQGAAADRLLSSLNILSTLSEPTTSEAHCAAALVLASQSLGLSVDGGEALLFAVSLSRNISFLTTGDKKAVRSLAEIEKHIPSVSEMRGRIIAFEHLTYASIRRFGFQQLSARLHTGAHCDKGLQNDLHHAQSDEAALTACLARRWQELNDAAPGFLAALPVP